MLRLVRQLVLRHGMDFDKRCAEDYSPISSAVRCAHLPVVDFLLEQYRAHGRLEKVLVTGCASTGIPLLHYCCVRDGSSDDDARRDVARALINDWGADVWTLSATACDSLAVGGDRPQCCARGFFHQ